MRLAVTASPPQNAIRVFPARTNWTPRDPLAFVGAYPDPALRGDLVTPPPADRRLPVYVSVTFRWHRSLAERIARSWAQHFDSVKIGGVAYDDPGDEFTPGMFIKIDCTITSRGCSKRCGWCDVWRREGAIRELTIKPGWIVQDNNLLACSERHIRAVFEMLRGQGRAIYFNGGLDKHYLREWHRDLFESISIGELWFACDTSADLPHLERAARILDGIPVDKRRCYTMIGYDNESLVDSERRCARVYELGFLPFCQLYQPTDGTLKVYPDAWRRIHRKWSRPAAYKSKPVPSPQLPLFTGSSDA